MDANGHHRARRGRSWLRALQQQRAIVLVAIASTVLTALVLMMLDEPRYEAEAQIVIRPPATSTVVTAADQVALVQREIAVIEGDQVEAQVRALVAYDPVPPVDAVAKSSGGVVLVRVRDIDPDVAAWFANAYAESYIALQGPPFDEGTSATVVRAATPPDSPVTPRPVRTTLLALLGGLVLGIIAAAIVNRFDDTIRSAADLDAEGDRAPLLAIVPHDPIAIQRPVRLHRGNDPSALAYRALRDMLPAVRLGQTVQVIQITSVDVGHGASLTALNLAATIGEQRESVVLVDTDLRRPEQHRLLGVDGSIGLVDNLADELIDMTVLPIEPYLTLLAAGQTNTSPIPLLGRRRMEDLVDELRRRYERIVLDSPPLLATGDAAVVSRLADGVVVVVSTGSSRRRLSEALDMLAEVEAPVLGLVLNRGPRR
jgi:polysaccharide biosynthesis transport protein